MENSVSNVGPLLIMLFLSLPLILGALVFLIKPQNVITWIESFNGWMSNKQAIVSEKTGSVSKWFFRPLLWGLLKIMSSTEQISDQYLRAAVRTTAYLFTIYVAGLIAYISISIFVALVIIGIAMWILSALFGGDTETSYKTSRTNPITSRLKGKDLFNTQGVFNKKTGRVNEDGRIFDTKGVFDKEVGRVGEDGRIFDTKGVFDKQTGRIDKDGNIYDTSGVFDKQVGRIDEDGAIKDTRGVFDKEIGKAK